GRDTITRPCRSPRGPPAPGGGRATDRSTPCRCTTRAGSPRGAPRPRGRRAPAGIPRSSALRGGRWPAAAAAGSSAGTIRGGVPVFEAEAGELRERAVVQLERRPRAWQVLDRRVALPVHCVVQDQMSLAEGPPLGVLPGEPGRRPLDDERGERQRLGVGPFDPALGEGPAPALQLAQQF